MSDSNKKTISTQEAGKKGATARHFSLTPERRREIALKANASRKCMLNLPKATHIGELGIGNMKISCSVLNDGKRIITQTSILTLLGKSKGGMKGRKPKAILELENSIGEQIPVFLAVSNLIPFMDSDLIQGGVVVEYLHPKFGKIKGYSAEIIPKICKAYLNAERAGVLTKDQKPIADKARAIQNALATVGIIGLIDEATGFERDREAQALQKLFSTYIAKELQPWVKRFDLQFFNNVKKIYGLNLKNKKTPSFVGGFINKYIYDKLSPKIRKELQRINPKNEQGNRKNRHHQYLTEDFGIPALDKQILKINTLMSISKNKEDFEKYLNINENQDQMELNI